MLRRSNAISKMVPGVSGVLFTRTEYTELMNLARDIERRLEAMVEGFAGKVFRGALHPVELTSRLVREADLALLSSEIGPIAPNVFEVRVGPAAVPDDIPDDLLTEIAGAVFDSAKHHGWRLQGPVEITLLEDESISSGSLVCTTSIQEGPIDSWATLEGKVGNFELYHNRTLAGRNAHADIHIPQPYLSRQHAIIWRDSGGIHIEDFRSANGTKVDGEFIDKPTDLVSGSVVTFGDASFSLRTV